MKTTLRLLPLPVFATLAFACGAPAPSEATATSSALLIADEALAADVTLYDDRIEVPAAGHEDLLAWPAGHVVVGKRARGHNGFFRRVASTSRAGDTIVVRTEKPLLTDAITNGEVMNKGGVDDPAIGAPTLGAQSLGGGLGGQVTLVPGTVILAQKQVLGGDGSVKLSGVHVNLDAKVREGYVRFQPTLDTHLSIQWGALQEFDLHAAGDLDAKLLVDVDVSADATITAELARELNPAHTKQKLIDFPRVYLPPQFVGIVPVYEAVDVSLSLGCDFTFGAQAHVTAGVEILGHAEAGGKYANGVWQPIGAPPSVTLTPTFDATLAGQVHATCYLEPTASLLFYDAVGPTLSIEPYVDADVQAASGGKLTWAVYPGVRAEAGGDLQLFGHEIASASFPLFDLRSATPLLGSAAP